jgi:hypothetical protein
MFGDPIKVSKNYIFNYIIKNNADNKIIKEWGLDYDFALIFEKQILNDKIAETTSAEKNLNSKFKLVAGSKDA